MKSKIARGFSGSDICSPSFYRGERLGGHETALETDGQYFGDKQAILDVVLFEFGQTFRDYHGRVLQNIKLRVTVGTRFSD